MKLQEIKNRCGLKNHFYEINPQRINWESEQSAVFFNEKHAKKQLFLSYISCLPCLKSHIWLTTSGRNYQKWVALSKKALLTSAEAVNKHLHITAEDRWGLSLPLFHVGGLSILARSYLSGSAYFLYHKKWQAKEFVLFLKHYKITISSLVPTQVYDLVKAGLNSPPSVRAIVVGGGHLTDSLYKSARNLGWPVLPSYGLTECGSQVATANLSSLDSVEYPEMKILSHVKVKIVKKEIAIQSDSLLSGFLPVLDSIEKSEKKSYSMLFQEGKKQGWYFTGDQGLIQENILQIDHISIHQIKILGEKVNFKNLENELMNILLKTSLKGRYFLLPVPHEREGFQIALITDTFDRKIENVIREFNQKVSPFERILQFYLVPFLPLTGILKISQKELLKKLCF